MLLVLKTTKTMQHLLHRILRGIGLEYVVTRWGEDAALRVYKPPAASRNVEYPGKGKLLSY